jgi:membrane protein
MDPNNTPVRNGYTAANPGAIPKKGWKEILLRVKDKIKEDNVSIVAAGVAFYFFLSLFPAIAAIFSIYGLVVDPAQVEQQLKQVADTLPADAHQMVTNILKQTAEKSSESLSWSLILSILFSIWSANKATSLQFLPELILLTTSRMTGICLRKQALHYFSHLEQFLPA